MSESFDVIIAGGGPVGLLLSCELALAGVSVLVLEKNLTRDSWRTGPLGFRGLTAGSTEAFYRRGLLGQLVADSTPRYFEKTTGFQYSGHFAGVNLDGNKVDHSHYKYDLPKPIKPEAVNLGNVETVLSKHAELLGVKIVRGLEFTKVTEEGNRVKVVAEGQSFEAQYLVGCDGGRSAVRRSAGFELVGTEPEFTGYITHCQTDPPLGPLFQYTGNGMTINNPNGNTYAIEYDLTFDRAKPITKEHFQRVLRRVTGTDIKVTSFDGGSSFTDHAKQVTQYRKGRVILAGDSAHLHSPVGGQGLNLGIGDAMNLGWKLAAAVKGYASPTLLDSYHQERHPVGEKVLNWTRAQTAIMRPDTHTKAMHQLMRSDFDKVGGPDRFVDHFYGLCQRYDLGDDHPLVGRSVPDFEFRNGQRLGPMFEEGHFIFVDFHQSQRVAEFLKALKLPIKYVGMTTNETFELQGLLVRPDGLVAWVTHDDTKLDALKAALSRWLALPDRNSHS